MMSFWQKKFEGITARIMRGGVGSFALNIANQILLFGITVLLTRLMLPEEYGLYAIILSLMMILALPFAGGFSLFTVRQIALTHAQQKYHVMKGLQQFGFFWIVFGSAIIGLLAYIILPFVVEDVAAYRKGLGLLILPPLLVFAGAILRGLHHVVMGRLPEYLIQPLVLFFILLFLFFGQAQGLDSISLDAKGALGFQIMSYGVALVVASIFLSCFIPRQARQSQPVFRIRSWFQSAWPLMLAVGILVVNTNIDIVMVGALAGEVEAGQYRVASRMAGFVLFFLFAANNVIAPMITTHHAQGQKEQLQKILTSVARLAMLGTLPVAVILWIWPQEILTFAFGIPFAAGAFALVILTSANFFSVAMGQVGQVMAMTGHEKDTAKAAFMAMMINIILNYILIPLYGMNGAAVATGVSILVWNGLLAYWTLKKTGYHCTVLGLLFSK